MEATAYRSLHHAAAAEPGSDRAGASIQVADPQREPAAAPPHLLWASLESAYAAEPAPAAPSRQRREGRLPAHLGLPIAVGLSLVLWVLIVELVLMR